MWCLYCSAHSYLTHLNYSVRVKISGNWPVFGQSWVRSWYSKSEMNSLLAGLQVEAVRTCVSQWSKGYGFWFVIEMLYVLFPAISLLCNEKLFTLVPLPSGSIIWHWPTGSDAIAGSVTLFTCELTDIAFDVYWMLNRTEILRIS